MANIWHKWTGEQSKRGHTKKMFGNKIIWERRESEDVKPVQLEATQNPDQQHKRDNWDWDRKYYDNGWSERWPANKRVSKWNYDHYGSPSGGGWFKSVITNKFLIQTLVAILLFMVAIGIYDKQDPTSKVASRAVKYMLNVDVNYEPIMGRIVKLVFPEIAGGPVNPNGGVVPTVGQQTEQNVPKSEQNTEQPKTQRGGTENQINLPVLGSQGDLKPGDNTISNTLTVKMTIPLNGTVIKKYGWVNDEQDGLKRYHEGIDIKAKLGTKVAAVLDGKVVKLGESEELGKYLQLSHNGEIITLYAHLDKILVEDDQIIKEGDYIGTVGETGSKDTPHLHFEIREKGELVDPWSKLNEDGI